MEEVLEYIENLEGEQKIIFEFLHEFILQYPGMTTKIRFKIPFYYLNSWICYINPKGSASVEIAFIRGNELSNDLGRLDFKNRKQVAGITVDSIAAIPKEDLAEILNEAVLLDETIPYKLKRKKK